MQSTENYTQYLVTSYTEKESENECVCVCSVVQSCPALCNPMDCSSSAPLSMEFSRQESWSRLPFPTPGDLSDPGIELMSLAYPSLTGGFFTTLPPGKPIYVCITESLCCSCETITQHCNYTPIKKKEKRVLQVLFPSTLLPIQPLPILPIRSFPCSSQPSQGQQWPSNTHYLAWALCRAPPSLGSLPPSGVSQHPISFLFLPPLKPGCLPPCLFIAGLLIALSEQPCQWTCSPHLLPTAMMASIVI